MPAWSYSSLSSYETCPRRHYETRVAKTVKEPEGLPLVLGNAAHKVLELAVSKGTPIPPTIQVTTSGGETGYLSTAGWDDIILRVLARGGEPHVERQIALDEKLCETEWFSREAWVRGIIDLALLRGKTALLLDYKTGKRKPDSDQLRLFAALAMHVWPQVEKVITGFLWLKSGQIDKEVYTRGDISAIWTGFLPRVKRLEAAYEGEKWEPKPSGLCKNYCPVSHCEFHGGGRR
jgi:hypothetical protein